MRALREMLQDALSIDCDEHGQFTRCTLALVDLRLGDWPAALATLAPIPASQSGDPSMDWIWMAVHFVRGVARAKLGDLASARSERDRLALLLTELLDEQAQGRLFLRELDASLPGR